MKIKVSVDVDPAIRQIERLRRQLPFAAAKALTVTAQDVQSHARAEATLKFRFRDANALRWTLQSVKVQPATKGSLSAAVYSEAPFMGKQEKGGLFGAAAWLGDRLGLWLKERLQSTSGPRLIAVPFQRRTGTRALVGGSGKRRFQVQRPDGSVLVLQRLRKSRGARVPGQRDPNVLALGVLEQSVEVPRRWSLEGVAGPVVERVWAGNFERAFEDAVGTGK